MTMKPKYKPLTNEKHTIYSKSDSSVIMAGITIIIHKRFY